VIYPSIPDNYGNSAAANAARQAAALGHSKSWLSTLHCWQQLPTLSRKQQLGLIFVLSIFFCVGNAAYLIMRIVELFTKTNDQFVPAVIASSFFSSLPSIFTVAWGYLILFQVIFCFPCDWPSHNVSS
jgi:hypothetical protein